MCTWSGNRCPSSIRLSFCSASLRNPSPRYFRNSPYSAFRRPLGINTTWYLHSPLEWLKLSYSSIQFLLCVCFAAHAGSCLDGRQYLSNSECLPGRAGGTPISLGSYLVWLQPLQIIDNTHREIQYFLALQSFVQAYPSRDTLA